VLIKASTGLTGSYCRPWGHYTECPRDQLTAYETEHKFPYQTFNSSLKSAGPERPGTAADRSDSGAEERAFADSRSFDVAEQDLLDVVPGRNLTGLSTFFREMQGTLGAVVLEALQSQAGYGPDAGRGEDEDGEDGLVPGAHRVRGVDGQAKRRGQKRERISFFV